MAFNLVDKIQIARSFSRAAKTYASAALVPQEIGQRLIDRLDLMRLQPKLVVDLGCGIGNFSKQLEQRYRKAEVLAIDMSLGMLQVAQQKKPWRTRQHFISAEASQLPLADHSVDLVFSNLLLHWCTDLKSLLHELKRVLKPEGLFLFSTLGPDTLQELRHSWATVDTKTHVHAFADMHDLGDWLVQTKFVDTVMDRDNITLTYQSINNLMHDLKNMGTHNLAADRATGLTTPRQLRRMLNAYETYRNADGVLPATVEVIYGHAWGPPLSTNTVANPAGEVYIPVGHIRKGNS